VSVAEIVHEALDLTRPLAEEAGITTTVSGDLSHYVRGDRQRVLQILLNLVSNAVKYNRERGSVDIACTDAGNGRVTLAVRDTGRGIATDDLERLFVPFDRIGLEAGTIEGAGLGLTLVQRLVEVMGGTLSVDSTEGVGSTFTFALPATEDPLAPADAPALPSGPERSQAATILYVEDNLANLKLVERALARQPGIKVLAATQGRLGIELARERKPDVVLLDLHLPDLTGEEVLHELTSDRETAGIPVIVVSATASKGRVQQLRQRGARDYLTKPIDLAQLLDAVNAALDDPRG
jgi:CheY-like chemotaxis protein/anti-sigma regulatory factor (Ser/Thr protein kinase)